MAHIEVNSFINQIITDIEPFYRHASVLEIGSYDVNGSVRSNFKDASKYVGVDLIPGPSVDVVTMGHLYQSNIKFDIVLSVESFEHNCYWVETFNNMIKLVDDNGIVIFTCATKGRLEHGTHRTDPFSSPGTSSRENSYYLNLSVEDFISNFSLKDIFISYDFYVNTLTKDLYFYGLKGNKKLASEDVMGFFKNAVKCSNKIRKKSNFLNYIKVKLFYFILSPFYILLSEDKYQNLTFFPYRLIRRLSSNFHRR